MKKGIKSPIKEIDKLILYVLPSKRPLNVLKAVRVNSATIFLGANGKIYCDRLRTNRFYSYDGCKWSKDTVEGLFRLGVINEKDLDNHNNLVDEYYSKIVNRRLAKSVLDDAKTLGINLTNSQIKQLKKVSA